MTSLRKNTKVGEGNVDGTYTNSHNNTHSHNTHNTNSHNTSGSNNKNSNNKKIVLSIGGFAAVLLLGAGANVFINQGRLQVSPQSPSEQQKVNTELPTSQQQNLPSKVLTLNQGQVTVFDAGTQKQVFLSGMPSSSNARGLNYLIVNDIPLSQYQSGLIKLNKNSKIRGTLRYYNDKTDTTNEYNLNTNGTDLTLQLNKNPTEVGEFVKGSLSGTVTNGVDKEKVSLQLVLPVTR
jgi:hypothetical protein